MSIVTRYFHIRPFLNLKGGATVKVVGDTERIGSVTVQVATCSKKDHYCRKTGRSEAEKAPTKVVPLRYLPRELEGLVKDSLNVFDFAIKYFLPKE